jgi:hypothetical protein
VYIKFNNHATHDQNLSLCVSSYFHLRQTCWNTNTLFHWQFPHPHFYCESKEEVILAYFTYSILMYERWHQWKISSQSIKGVLTSTKFKMNGKTYLVCWVRIILCHSYVSCNLLNNASCKSVKAWDWVNKYTKTSDEKKKKAMLHHQLTLQGLHSPFEKMLNLYQ